MPVRSERLTPLRAALEEQFERLTAELTRLTRHATAPERIGYDRPGLQTRLAGTRQKLAETTQALRRIAQGTYGVCERCQAQIPVERLERCPCARYCVPCHRSLEAGREAAGDADGVLG